MATSAELLRFEKATRVKARAAPIVFDGDAVQKAKAQLQQLATMCIDPKIRKEAAQFIVTAQTAAATQAYQGVEGALEELAGMPPEHQRAALLIMYGRNMITKDDLDTVLKIVASAEQAKIAALEAHNLGLVKKIEEQNERLFHAPTPHMPQGAGRNDYAETTVIEGDIALPLPMAAE